MKRIAFLVLGMGLALLALGGTMVRAAEGPDLSQIPRRIKKEPAYTAGKPLFALYVFGPQARLHVWAVLDKSQPDATHYDILYFDRNGDGDLTADDERIEGTARGEETLFEIGTIEDRETEQVHTGLSLTHHAGKDSRTMLRMKWCDKVMVRGGYAPEPGPYTEFAETPAEAPILWPAGDGAFSFQFWMIDTLHIGESEHVRVFLGHQGQGKNTFCAVPDTFLPREIPVIATLIYRDKDDKERRARSELTERC